MLTSLDNPTEAVQLVYNTTTLHVVWMQVILQVTIRAILKSVHRAKPHSFSLALTASGQHKGCPPPSYYY
eukprot:1999377-Pleurochrysis_carterae.AAC.5